MKTARCVVVLATLLSLVLPRPAAGTPAQLPPVDFASRDAWRTSMTRTHLPKGCFRATYPAIEWRQVSCAPAPSRPFLPARGLRAETVGNGTDFTASVPNLISSAVGSFDRVTGVTFEEGYGQFNSYSLQLNVKPFQTPVCAGSANPSNCLGWQQFLLAPEVFMQYWLIGY